MMAVLSLPVAGRNSGKLTDISNDTGKLYVISLDVTRQIETVPSLSLKV